MTAPSPLGTRKPAALRILIAGVGNELRTDDGIGIHALRELQRNGVLLSPRSPEVLGWNRGRQPQPPEQLIEVTLVEIGTAILHGVEFLASAHRVLVIDAAKGGHPPGTLYLFEAGQSGAPEAPSSIHAMGLREAAQLLLNQPAPPITILGVEPESLDYGMSLSASLQAVLPQIVALARQTVAGWQAAARADQEESTCAPQSI